MKVLRIILALLTICAGLFLGGFMLYFVHPMVGLVLFVMSEYLAWIIVNN